MNFNFFTLTLTIIGSGGFGSFIMHILNRAKQRAEEIKTDSDMRLAQADYLTKKYKEFSDMNEERYNEQKQLLENEILRSKGEENKCRIKLADYETRLSEQTEKGIKRDELIESQNKRIEELENLKNNK